MKIFGWSLSLLDLAVSFGYALFNVKITRLMVVTESGVVLTGARMIRCETSCEISPRSNLFICCFYICRL